MTITIKKEYRKKDGGELTWRSADSTGENSQSESAADFVAYYQMLHLGLEGSCNASHEACKNCVFRVAGGGEEYGDNDGEGDDWCRLYAGAYMDGQEHRCPAWISSQNAED